MFTDCLLMLSLCIYAFSQHFPVGCIPFSELGGNLSFLSVLDCLLFIKSSIKHQSCHKSKPCSTQQLILFFPAGFVSMVYSP